MPANRSTDYLLSLRDAETGGFRFSAGRPVSLMATCYAVLGLEFENSLSRLSSSERSQLLSFLLSSRGEDGRFRDPRFREENILSQQHDRAFFEEEATAFCLQVLDALGEAAPDTSLPGSWTDPGRMTAWIESLAWRDPWLDSNRVMFALSRASRSHPASLDAALDWLDAQQNKETGLWHGRGRVPLSYAMAASVHFTFYYTFRKRPVRYAERIVDSCLSLQASHGLFDRGTIGHTCFDYDAVQLLKAMDRQVKYRNDAIGAAMSRAAAALHTLENPDGGFAEAKRNLWHFLGRPLPLPLSKEVSKDRVYHNCLKELSCASSSSNVYSTWLRRVTLALAEGREGNFRRLPFLGSRP